MLLHPAIFFHGTNIFIEECVPNGAHTDAIDEYSALLWRLQSGGLRQAIAIASRHGLRSADTKRRSAFDRRNRHEEDARVALHHQSESFEQILKGSNASISSIEFAGA